MEEHSIDREVDNLRRRTRSSGRQQEDLVEHLERQDDAEGERPAHLPFGPAGTAPSTVFEAAPAALIDLPEAALVIDPDLAVGQETPALLRHGLDPADPFLWCLLLISLGVVRLARGGLKVYSRAGRTAGTVETRELDFDAER